MTVNHDKKTITIIIPLYNEEKNIPLLHKEVREATSGLPYTFEFLFINDGSEDTSTARLEQLSKSDPHVHFVEFSRNFGKEIATTAGLHAAEGKAAIIMDADLQHPPRLIPEFIQAWEGGAEVVVGVRRESKSESALKRIGSRWFYHIMSSISETEVVPQATDFRLLDRIVIEEFNRLTEHSRITRGLIDWVGFRRHHVFFDAGTRRHGKEKYSLPSLIGLAMTSFISMSLFPLRLAGYLGGVIVLASSVLGVVEIVDRYFHVWSFNFSGPAILATLLLFLVGIVLIALGLLAFYIGHIYRDTQNRPLYVIRRQT